MSKSIHFPTYVKILRMILKILNHLAYFQDVSFALLRMILRILKYFELFQVLSFTLLLRMIRRILKGLVRILRMILKILKPLA